MVSGTRALPKGPLPKKGWLIMKLRLFPSSQSVIILFTFSARPVSISCIGQETQDLINWIHSRCQFPFSHFVLFLSRSLQDSDLCGCQNLRQNLKQKTPQRRNKTHLSRFLAKLSSLTLSNNQHSIKVIIKIIFKKASQRKCCSTQNIESTKSSYSHSVRFNLE